jgi:hypothetical protein
MTLGKLQKNVLLRFTSPPIPLSASREGELVDYLTPLSTLWRGGRLWGRIVIGLTDRQATPKDGVR